MARTNSLSNFLTDIITALKNKLETTELIRASEVDTKIKNIQGKVKANGKRENYTVADGYTIQARRICKY